MRTLKFLIVLTALLMLTMPAFHAFAASDEDTQGVTLPTITDGTAIDPATPADATDAEVEVHAAQYSCYYSTYYCYGYSSYNPYMYGGYYPYYNNYSNGCSGYYTYYY